MNMNEKQKDIHMIINWYDGLNLNLNVDGLRLVINVFDFVFILNSYFVSQLPSCILQTICNSQCNVILQLMLFIKNEFQKQLRN